MKVVIAPDKFKGSLDAVEAARAMAEGVSESVPGAEVVLCPMADGGEGTVDAIAAATGARIIVERVGGPLPGGEVEARWAYIASGTLPRAAAVAGDISPDLDTAVIEMAQASGLWLVPPEERNPFVTTTYGTGQLICAALDAGCRQVVVGVGGSSTVDGGCGMASALGYRFLDAGGSEVPLGGGGLEAIASIDSRGRDPRLTETRFVVASDVDSPLVGPDGAARVFGPQKGATPSRVESLERGLEGLGVLMKDELGVDVSEVPGAGAAGGLGAGLLAFCGAEIESGVGLVAGLVGLRQRLEGADLVLTGEGSFDSQTSHGKAPAGVALIARKAGVPVVVVAGRLADGSPAPLGPGVATFCVVPGPVDMKTAMESAADFVRSGTARLVRLLDLMN